MGRGRGEGREREEKGERGREGREGEGKTLWICSPRKNFLATPLDTQRIG